LFQQLTTEISRRRQRVSPLDASQLAWSMARMEYRCEQLLWQLQGDLLHQLHHCDGRHLANTLWSFAKLSCALLASREVGAVHFQLPSEEAKWQVPRKLFANLASKKEEWMRVKQSQNGCPKQSQNGCPNMTSLMHLVVAHGSPG
jgi:hypothetical protein